MAEGHAHPTFAEAFRFWLKLGLISFGGPSGQIAMMHEELVERRRWISNARFLHALNYCMLLPGPEATQLATYIGWLLHRTRGGIVAGTLFVLPSAIVLWLLSVVYVTWGNVSWIASIFYGLKPVVLAIVAAAVIRIGSRALKNEIMWSIALLAFVAIFIFKIPFPAIVFSAGLLGLVGGKFWPKKFLVTKSANDDSNSSILSDDADSPAHTKPSLRRGLKVCIVSLVLWFAPVAAIALWLGVDHALFREGIFFSKAAMVTFGGAYAVLPYVSQQAVEHYGWLAALEMLDGLGLAETTPGPLIIVLQFVGFLGGWHQPQPLTPLVAATVGAFITTWTTFVPCFLWIFLGAPHIERLRGNNHLTSALSTITASVVGVILNLAVWFAQHTVLPVPNQIDWFVVAVALVAFLGIWRWKWNVIVVVLTGGLLGLVYKSIIQ